MNGILTFMGTICAAVNQSCACTKTLETNCNDVKVIFIIAVALLIALLIVSILIYGIVRLKKYEGIKALVEEALKDSLKQDKKDGK